MTDNKYVIRIKKIILDNFKSVEHGEVLFNCGKRFVIQGTEADIMGIYGQNGSGKSAVVEAIIILKSLLMGTPVGIEMDKCIAIGKDHSSLEFHFDIQSEDGIIRNTIYSFDMKYSDVADDSCESAAFEDSLFGGYIRSNITNHKGVSIYNECVKMSGIFNGKTIKMQPVIYTTEESYYPFLPLSKMKEFIKDPSEEVLEKQWILQRKMMINGYSYIFCREALEEFSKDNESDYVQILLTLNTFGSEKLFIVDTDRSSLNALSIPFYGLNGGKTNLEKQIVAALGGEDDDFANYMEMFKLPVSISIDGYTDITVEAYEELKRRIENMNTLLSEVIPGMRLEVEADIDKEEDTATVRLLSDRNGTVIPLLYESGGIKRLVIFWDLLIKAYNDKSMTLVIDEIDAGIFEYLLGVVLQVFQEGGRGQLVFTCHNLRPLEVLENKYLCFTTTNKNNRYIRIKNVGQTNNLRSLYYREIINGSQDEELYKGTLKVDIAYAFRKAGGYNVEA